MRSIIYLIRHSEPMMKDIESEYTTEEVFIINKKIPLTGNGEEIARNLSLKDEFQNIDKIYSSTYSRALATAKYFAYQNGLKINVDERLGERIHGIKAWDELPSDFEEKQFLDRDYKYGFGESRNEVEERLYSVFMEILKKNIGKRIILVGHSTAFSFLLGKWCDINYKNNFYFNGEVFFDGKWKYCEAFKLEFEDDKLISIKEVY